MLNIIALVSCVVTVIVGIFTGNFIGCLGWLVACAWIGKAIAEDY